MNPDTRSPRTGRTALRLLAPALLVTLWSAACSSSGGAPLAPSAPAPGVQAAPAPAPAAGGARIAGVVVVSGQSAVAGLNARALGASSITVSVNGTGLSTVTDALGNFTLDDVPPGNRTLTFAGPGVSSALDVPTVEPNEQIRLTVRVNATSVTVDDQQRQSAGEVEIAGAIASIAGSTLVIGTAGIAVTVPATAAITRGTSTVPFASLAVGMRVEIRGTQTGSTVTAASIEIEDGAGVGAPDDPGTDASDDDRSKSGGNNSGPGGAGSSGSDDQGRSGSDDSRTSGSGSSGSGDDKGGSPDSGSSSGSSGSGKGGSGSGDKGGSSSGGRGK